MREAKRLKASGYKRGFPDVFIYEPRGRWHGLAIELKRDKGGRLSAPQREWIAALEARGYRAVVAKGLEAAKEVLTEYLGTTPSSGI